MAEKQIEKNVEQDAAFAAVIAGAVAKAVAETTAALDAKKAPPENKLGSLVSPFNPEGLKVRPRIGFKVYFCGAELDENFLTNDEIRKLSTITFSGDFHRNQWHVRQVHDGDTTKVRIDLPVKTLDQRMDIPNSLMAILDEIKTEYAAQQAKAKATA